jgi:hypothetical protein
MSVYGNIICRFFMPRSKRDWTEEKRDRYMKEGRGQGSGRDYKPWIEVSDFSSSGRVSRDLGWKSNRVHYLMSDGETRLYYLFEWSDQILGIRDLSKQLQHLFPNSVSDLIDRYTLYPFYRPFLPPQRDRSS